MNKYILLDILGNVLFRDNSSKLLDSKGYDSKVEIVSRVYLKYIFEWIKITKRNKNE